MVHEYAYFYEYGIFGNRSIHPPHFLSFFVARGIL